MPADDPVDAQTRGFERHRRLEVADVAHGVLDLVLDGAGQGPVGQSELAPHQVEPGVDAQQQVVRVAAQQRDGPGRTHDAVELVTVDDQETLAVGLAVNDAVDDLDVAEGHAVIVPQHLVVVTGHVDHLGAVLGLAENRSKNVVVVLGPKRPFPHGPDVDDVTDKIEKFAFHRTEEGQQGRGAAATKSQVDIGKPDRTVNPRFRGIQHVATSMSRTTLGQASDEIRSFGPDSPSFKVTCQYVRMVTRMRRNREVFVDVLLRAESL